jgi:hypothetical protein
LYYFLGQGSAGLPVLFARGVSSISGQSLSMPRALEGDKFYPWLAIMVLLIIIVDIFLFWHLF